MNFRICLVFLIFSFRLCYGQSNQNSDPVDPSYYSNPQQLTFSNYSGGLVQMQGYYDQVTINLSSTHFKLTSYLDPDSKDVLIMNEIARKKLSEIQENFKVSKNYRQAEAMRIQLINIYYFEELSLIAIKKNFDDFKHACDLREKLVLSNSMTLNEYERWKTRVLELYSERGGCNFKNDGSYNSISKIISEIAKN